MAQTMISTSRREGDIWTAVRDRLRKELGDPVFDAWIASLHLISSEHGEVKIGAPKPLVRSWVSNHHSARIERALKAEGLATRSVSIVLAPRIGGGLELERQHPTLTPYPAVPRPALGGNNTGGNNTGGHGTGSGGGNLWSRMLHPAQTFDSFIVGTSNEFAAKAARAFAENTQGDGSLLYLHGTFGSGKSHLLNATTLEASKRGRRALCLGAEEFMRQFLGALHRKEALVFKDELRAAEILLIDDLQHICNSSATIAEFLHTINAFADTRRSIVIAADRAPEGFEALGENIRSRLSGGVVIAVGAPDRATRMAMLKARTTEFVRECPHAVIPDEVLERVADLDGATPREILGVFNRMATWTSLTKKPVTLEVAEESIGQRAAPGRKVAIEDIQRKTAEFYKLDPRDMHSKERSRRIARPRQVAMYLARELTQRSLPEIGRRFGGRDHTTILHACRQITKLCGSDQLLKQEVDFLRQLLSKRVA
ncbi:MAG TPA: chromosomal replication initiator protein DnaA [Rhizomicrobium sp.]|jgi:chromosomal replication initiator protein